MKQCRKDTVPELSKNEFKLTEKIVKLQNECNFLNTKIKFLHKANLEQRITIESMNERLQLKTKSSLS